MKIKATRNTRVRMKTKYEDEYGRGGRESDIQFGNGGGRSDTWPPFVRGEAEKRSPTPSVVPHKLRPAFS